MQTRITDIDKDVLVKIFRFGTPQQIKLNKSVCTLFRAVGKRALAELTRETQEQQFFAVGKQIFITAPRNRLEKYVSGLIGVDYGILYLNFRNMQDNSLQKDIKQAFPPHNPSVKLFISESEAALYSRNLRTYIDGEHTYQPAIYKVQFLGDMRSVEFVNENITILHDSEDDNFDEYHQDVSYFTTDIDNIVPLYGKLKISPPEGLTGAVIESPVYDFKPCEIKNENGVFSWFRK